MRVLLVVGQLGGGGAERQLVNFLRSAPDFIENDCFLLNSGGRWQDDVGRMCHDFHPCGRSSRFARLLEFLRYVRHSRPRLVHCWNAYTAIYPLVTRRIHRLPVVVNVRGDITRNPRGRKHRLPLHYRLLARADWIVSNSESNLAALRQSGLRLDRTTVIRNGIEAAQDRPSASVGGLQTIVGVGSLSELKNWPQLIRVAGRLRAEGSRFKLRILGEGPQRADLERLCLQKGLDPGEVFPGYATDLRRRLARATLLVHCSRTEGSPNAVLEALAAGLPVVATDLPSTREIDDSRGIIRFFPAEDDRRCAERIVSLLEDPALRHQLGQRGQAWIRSRYSCVVMARAFVDVYSKALG